ncbi:hypothetical protein CO058_01015 [candidate division WWE3 bacterium CG_4_9_14_0_2_um_filter_35_11]|uniref:DUF4012 domain-containing protein n=1 Tax=candidate division WWE3 bacterium CG_4_9_14_0_2_um_filter_35_11 TaxID=1975077 RepID=A0A2M8EME8_UNCKA|nr:MAG: hypothetical protein COV25_03140 [candidate division WWE3 bacterium CG10_big_fil_rev_8_21_14_0_10_35_32]PJC23899.1 MAG: hypothetical protein CO058_01015 [candidate division WWE3 bacterium CG_4_9_14_0_2_um_filter_35_11]
MPEFANKFSLPKISFNFKILLNILIGFIIFLVIAFVVVYFFLIRPALAIANEAEVLKQRSAQITTGLRDFNFTEVNEGLLSTKNELVKFESVYQQNMSLIRKFPKTEAYYQDSQRLLASATQGIELGELAVNILEPYAADLGFSTNGVVPESVPAQERVTKLMSLMPQFAPKVNEISEKIGKINDELSQIDATRYPKRLPFFVKYFGVDPSLDLRSQISTLQAVTKDVSDKAPQFEAMFNAFPEFMGLNEPKKYLILMANNYEIRMSGGFNTYIVAVEFDKGVPQITYSIDTYFIDEGDRTGSSFLVNRNVPYFLRNYLYLKGNTYRLYARDATSVSPDFPIASDNLLTGFWRKDRSLPQKIDGVIQINNDVVVDMLKVVGPVNTDKYSVKTDNGSYITVPFTEFNSDNVINELENIAGGKLAQTIGRKEIIKFLGQSMLEKVFTSEATNLLNITKVMLDALSKKDVILYSFDTPVQVAFENLGYSGEVDKTPVGFDYLHVNRSNFGAGKADWSKEGFVTQSVKKDVNIVDGKKIGTVEVTIHNPKRPDWYNIDPCCFYNAYLRVYVPIGSKMISTMASDGQEANGAEYADMELEKTFFESFTRQQKETDLTVTYTYELPESVNIDDYNVLIQRQAGTSIDDYTIGLNGVSQKILLNSDKKLNF